MYYQRLIILLFFFFQTLNASSTTNSYKIIAYYPEWGIYKTHNYYLPSAIPFKKITHLHYAFATIKDGKIAHFDKYASIQKIYENNSSLRGNLGALKKLKQKHPHLSLIISIGGWTQSGNFHTVASTYKARNIFASSIIKYLREYSMDGVDIDWEFPTVYREANLADNPFDQGSPHANESEKKTYTLLLQTLRKHLDIASKEDNKTYQLSVAVSPIFAHIEQTQVKEYMQYVDYITLMTYNMHGSWDKITNHHTALYPHPCAFDTMNIQSVVNKFISLGVAPNKLIVGTPFFGRSWREVDNRKYAPSWIKSHYIELKCWLIYGINLEYFQGLFRVTSGGAKGLWDSGTAYTGVYPYYYLAQLQKNKKYQKYYDPQASATYLYDQKSRQMYSYENQQSLLKKIEYIQTNNLGGIAIWEITGDAPTNSSDNLLNLIYNKLILDFNH